MTTQYYADILSKHTSLKTPFWASIPESLKCEIAHAFPDDDVPDLGAQATSSEAPQSKLLLIKDLLEKTFATREASLEPTDPLRFFTMHALGMTYSELGQLEQVERIYETLISESNKAFGPDQKNALAAVFNLSGVYEQLGKLDESAASYRKCMQILADKVGVETPQYLGAIRGLVGVLTKQEKYDEAEALLKEGQRIIAGMGGPFKTEEDDEMKEAVVKLEKARK
jgi:tetratricopeptide (TPR) repeat protein